MRRFAGLTTRPEFASETTLDCCCIVLSCFGFDDCGTLFSWFSASLISISMHGESTLLAGLLCCKDANDRPTGDGKGSFAVGVSEPVDPGLCFCGADENLENSSGCAESDGDEGCEAIAPARNDESK